MWDWELLKNGSGIHRYDILGKYSNEDFQYTHAVTYGTQQDDYCVHSHSMYEIVYAISGSVVYMVEGTRYPIEPGSLLIISPAVPHKLIICSSEPFERHILYIYFAGNSSVLSSMMAQCQNPVKNKRVGSALYREEYISAIKNDFLRMSTACRSPKKYICDLTPYFAQALIAALTLVIDEKEPDIFSQSSSKTVDGLMLYLSKNYTKPLTLQGIADTFSVSKDYCNRLFRQATGMTVIQYVIYCRVLHAKQLLAEGVPPTEAATQAGFRDYSNFFRIYRRVTGRMPSDDYEIAEGVLVLPKGMASPDLS